VVDKNSVYIISIKYYSMVACAYIVVFLYSVCIWPATEIP